MLFILDLVYLCGRLEVKLIRERVIKSENEIELFV